MMSGAFGPDRTRGAFCVMTANASWRIFHFTLGYCRWNSFIRLIGTWNPVSTYAFSVTGFVPHAFASVGDVAPLDADAGTTVATTAAILSSRTTTATPASIRTRPRCRHANSRRSTDGSIITPPFDYVIGVSAEQRHHESK